MTGRFLPHVLLLAMLTAVTGAAAKETGKAGHAVEQPASSEQHHAPPPPLLADIDRLFELQDSTARGNIAAARAQSGLLRDIGEALKTLDPAQARAIAPAVAAYVLSGGDPAAAERLAADEDLPPEDRRLLEAAAVFMRGDRGLAAKLFAQLDPQWYPARLVGRVSLARALLDKTDARQQYLALAIAAMPGTLVEESALRRSALAYAEVQSAENFWQRLDRYNRRFHGSLYAGNFWEEAMGLLVPWTMKGTPPSLDRLDLMLSSLSAAQRRKIYLALARHATSAGAERIADFAGRRLERLALAGSVEEQLGRLYTAIYALISEDGDQALATLRSLRRDGFAARERALLEAALALGRKIEQPITVAAAADGAPRDVSPLESRGLDLLKDTYALLQEAD